MLYSAFYIMLLWGWSFFTDAIITPDKVQNYLTKDEISISSWDISPYQDDCDISYIWSDLILDMSCFISGTDLDIDHAFTQLDPDIITLKSNIDLVRDNVSWFADIYDTNNNTFNFSWSKVTFRDNDSSYLHILENLNHKPINSNIYLLIKYWYKMKLSKKDMAMRFAKYNYYFAVSDRDISKYGECAKTNFRVAFEQMGNRLLKPWDTLDINTLFANLDWYCKWDGEDFMFYQWVCGVSTQVFRLWVLFPELWVYKRQNHNIRYTVYYGDEVVWDDAAIYEDIKKLEIRNDSNQDIYLLTKSWDKDRYYLVSAYPIKPGYTIKVEKQPLDNLSANLRRTINYFSGSVKEDDRFSQYLSVSNDSN